jgi:hypothetical protein
MAITYTLLLTVKTVILRILNLGGTKKALDEQFLEVIFENGL